MNPITNNHAAFKTTADYTVKNTEYYWRMCMRWILGALFFSPISPAPKCLGPRLTQTLTPTIWKLPPLPYCPQTTPLSNKQKVVY